MRKLEGLVKEIVDELDYLKKREERFANTNSTSSSFPSHANTPPVPCSRVSLTSLDEQTRAKLCLVYALLPRVSGCMADFPPSRLL